GVARRGGVDGLDRERWDLLGLIINDQGAPAAEGDNDGPAGALSQDARRVGLGRGGPGEGLQLGLVGDAEVGVGEQVVGQLDGGGVVEQGADAGCPGQAQGLVDGGDGDLELAEEQVAGGDEVGGREDVGGRHGGVGAGDDDDLVLGVVVDED